MKNLTRDFVAGEMEMSTSGYGKIERGEIDLTISKIARIASILGISISDLLFFDVSIFFNNNTINEKRPNNTQRKEAEVKVMNLDHRFLHQFDDENFKQKSK